MKHDINMDGLNVCIGMPSSRDIPPLTVKSLLGTYSLCNELNIPCQFTLVAGNAIVQWARDEVVNLFLETDANRLFWIDSDIIWEPEDFVRLLALSQKNKVVGATYPAKVDPPTFYVHREEKPIETDKYGLMDVWGIGLGFTVMHREVVEKVHKQAPKIYDEISKREVSQIFRVGYVDGKRQGEDMAFFDDIRELGYKVKLDPSIDLGHVGSKIYTGSIADAYNIR